MPKIFAISDLHLGFSCDKPMNIFGTRWDNHEEKIFINWQNTVSEDDVVLIAGDISWETYVTNATADFDFINKLNGTKIITKGNHDYWWETLSKLNKFLDENNFNTIKFLHNTNVVFGDVCITGTKGYPETEGIPTAEDEKKKYLREILRLQNAVIEAEKTGAKKTIVMLHYPPGTDSEFAKILKEASVDYCIYGHLHGTTYGAVTNAKVGGVEYRLTSCDYLKFAPIEITEF